MSVADIIKEKEPDFENIIRFFKNEIAGIRTGRATPALVEDIKVNIYNQDMRIKELASITIPEPKVIAIQPWDKSAVEAITNALQKSDIGINPTVNGTIIRLILPQLTQERRQDFIKLLKQKTEEARIKVRRVREGIWEKIQDMEKAGEIREDDKFAGKDELQKTVDGYNQQIIDLEKKKEEELMHV